MKVLHTSDWHIGKKLNGRLRLDEQKKTLMQICELCENEGVDLVLVAGDVFDTYTPSAEAEQLFFECMKNLASPSRAVVVISGNHDDPVRLSASHLIASNSNVYIFGGENTPALGGDAVRATRIGKNFIQIEKSTDKAYIGVLPYPSEQRLGEKKGNLDYNEMVKEWIDNCFSSNVENAPCMLCSHLFLLGGERGESERDIELGGARILPLSVIPESCLYTALGHIHKRQVISNSRNIIYSGSIMQYAFDEVGVQKSVTIFDFDAKGVNNLKVFKLTCSKQLVKLVALGVEEAKRLLENYADCLVYLTLKTDRPLSELESRELLGNYPQLVDYKLETFAKMDNSNLPSRKELNDKELFQSYYFAKYGEEAPEDIMQLYLKAMLGEEV